MSLSVKNMLGGGKAKTYAYYWEKFEVQQVRVESLPQMLNAGEVYTISDSILADTPVYRSPNYTKNLETGEYVLESPTLFGTLSASGSTMNLTVSNNYYIVGGTSGDKMFYINSYFSSYRSYFSSTSSMIRLYTGSLQSESYLPVKYEMSTEPNYMFVETVGSDDEHAYPKRGIAEDGFHYVSTIYDGGTLIPNCFSKHSSDIREKAYEFKASVDSKRTKLVAINKTNNEGSNASYLNYSPLCVMEDGTVVRCSASSYGGNRIYVMLPNGERFIVSGLMSGTLGMAYYGACFPVSDDRFVLVTNSTNYSNKIAILFELDRDNLTITRVSSTTFGDYNNTSVSWSPDKRVFNMNGVYCVPYGVYVSKSYKVVFDNITVDGDTLLCEEVVRYMPLNFNTCVTYVASIEVDNDGNYTIEGLTNTTGNSNSYHYYSRFVLPSDGGSSEHTNIYIPNNTTDGLKNTICDDNYIYMPIYIYDTGGSTSGYRVDVYTVNRKSGEIKTVRMNPDAVVTLNNAWYCGLVAVDNLLIGLNPTLFAETPSGDYSMLTSEVRNWANITSNYTPSRYVYNGHGLLYGCGVYDSFYCENIFDISEWYDAHELYYVPTTNHGVTLNRHASGELVNASI